MYFQACLESAQTAFYLPLALPDTSTLAATCSSVFTQPGTRQSIFLATGPDKYHTPQLANNFGIVGTEVMWTCLGSHTALYLAFQKNNLLAIQLVSFRSPVSASIPALDLRQVN